MSPQFPILGLHSVHCHVHRLTLTSRYLYIYIYAWVQRQRRIEAVNGAWAMIGLTAGLVTEAQTGDSIPAQVSLINLYIYIYIIKLEVFFIHGWKLRIILQLAGYWSAIASQFWQWWGMASAANHNQKHKYMVPTPLPCKHFRWLRKGEGRVSFPLSGYLGVGGPGLFEFPHFNWGQL